MRNFYQLTNGNMDVFSPSFFQVAFIYVFNLIIGVGALTMPKAFANAGWLIASVLIGILCLMRLVEVYRYHSNYYYYYHYHYYGVIITALIIVCLIFSFAILPHPLPLYLILQDLEGHSSYKDQTAPWWSWLLSADATEWYMIQWL